MAKERKQKMSEELIERLKITEQMLNVAHFKEAESLIREARDAIEELQSAQSERKKGKWEMRWHYFFHAEVPICSQCLKVSPFKFDFCPRCGSDMREEKTDETN